LTTGFQKLFGRAADSAAAISSADMLPSPSTSAAAAARCMMLASMLAFASASFASDRRTMQRPLQTVNAEKEDE
jgi:hypothetical protein